MRTRIRTFGRQRQQRRQQQPRRRRQQQQQPSMHAHIRADASPMAADAAACAHNAVWPCVCTRISCAPGRPNTLMCVRACVCACVYHPEAHFCKANQTHTCTAAHCWYSKYYMWYTAAGGGGREGERDSYAHGETGFSQCALSSAHDPPTGQLVCCAAQPQASNNTRMHARIRELRFATRAPPLACTTNTHTHTWRSAVRINGRKQKQTRTAFKVCRPQRH